MIVEILDRCWRSSPNQEFSHLTLFCRRLLWIKWIFITPAIVPIILRIWDLLRFSKKQYLWFSCVLFFYTCCILMQWNESLHRCVCSVYWVWYVMPPLIVHCYLVGPHRSTGRAPPYHLYCWWGLLLWNKNSVWGEVECKMLGDLSQLNTFPVVLIWFWLPV